LSGILGDYLLRDQMNPDETLRSRYESALMDRLNPQLDRDRAAAEARLANQGIGVGSRAYSATQRDLGQSANDARVAAILRGGDEQARDLQMRAGARGSRINEIAALLGGSQVQMPNYQINQPSQIPTTDNAGLINANFGQQQNNYNQQMAQWNNTMGGLFGMGSAFIGRPRV
jgi:hypothetical protein